MSRMYSERKNLRPWRPPNTSRREPAAQAACPNISPGMSFLLSAVPVALRQVLLPADCQGVSPSLGGNIVWKTKMATMIVMGISAVCASSG